jgi:hypothetical protein
LFLRGERSGFFLSLFSANEEEEKWISLPLFPLHLLKKKENKWVSDFVFDG